MCKLDRDQLAIGLGPTPLRANPVRFDRCVGPYDDNRARTTQFGHYLITEVVADGETGVPPDAPTFGFQHRNKFRCQRPICSVIADKNICHGRAHSGATAAADISGPQLLLSGPGMLST